VKSGIKIKKRKKYIPVNPPKMKKKKSSQKKKKTLGVGYRPPIFLMRFSEALYPGIK